MAKNLDRSFTVTWDRIVDVGDSSNISEVRYNFATRLMRVTFLSGDSYSYFGVTDDTFGHLVSRKSIGKAFAGIRSHLESKGFEKCV